MNLIPSCKDENVDPGGSVVLAALQESFKVED